jgi:hypothetical protein
LRNSFYYCLLRRRREFVRQPKSKDYIEIERKGQSDSRVFAAGWGFIAFIINPAVSEYSIFIASIRNYVRFFDFFTYISEEFL